MTGQRKITMLIEQKRREKGLNQNSLAKKVGISKNMLISYEKSRTTPTIEVLLRISDVLECSVNDLVIVNEPRKYLFREGMRLCLTENVDLIYEDAADVLGIDNKVIANGRVANYYDKCEKYFSNYFEQQYPYRTGEVRVDHYSTLKYHFLNGYENETTFSTDMRDIVMSKCNGLTIEHFFEDSYRKFYAMRNAVKEAISQRYRLTDEEKEGMLVSCLNRYEIVIESNYLLGAESKKSIDAFIEWVNRSGCGRMFNPIS